MLDKQEREQIIALINREVVPAIGCTEPMAVSLCVAKAAEALGVRPARIDVLLSSNILKNAMGVGIPGTGMVGLPIAIALGALIGRSEYELEVLRDVTPDAVEQGRQYMSEKRISIGLKKDNCPDKLYIEALVSPRMVILQEPSSSTTTITSSMSQGPPMAGRRSCSTRHNRTSLTKKPMTTSCRFARSMSSLPPLRLKNLSSSTRHVASTRMQPGFRSVAIMVTNLARR